MAERTLNPELLCQVGIIVRDIEATARRYADTFGLPMPDIVVTPGYDVVKTTVDGQPSEATAKLAFLQTGQMVVELIQPDDKPSVWRAFLDKNGEGVHHIAFQVSDTKATERYLSQWGIDTAQQGLYSDASGMYTYVNSEPVLGVMLELLESFKR